jgi:hypothetical protein
MDKETNFNKYFDGDLDEIYADEMKFDIDEISHGILLDSKVAVIYGSLLNYKRFVTGEQNHCMFPYGPGYFVAIQEWLRVNSEYAGIYTELHKKWEEHWEEGLPPFAMSFLMGAFQQICGLAKEYTAVPDDPPEKQWKYVSDTQAESEA